MVQDSQSGFDRNTLRVLAIVVFMLIVVRRAWMCDDAFISMRVVNNFVGGYGLTFNPDERVQGFTNPLWVLLWSAYPMPSQGSHTGAALAPPSSLRSLAPSFLPTG